MGLNEMQGSRHGTIKFESTYGSGTANPSNPVDQGPSIARQIHDSLQTFKQTTYSTTVKMLSVMLGKGLVKRDESVSPQVYRAAVTRDVAGKRLVKDLVEKVYDGQRQRWFSMRFALENHQPKTWRKSENCSTKWRPIMNQVDWQLWMDWLSGPALERLGWVLIHSLWQLALIGSVAWLFDSVLRRNNAQTRYWTSVLFLAMMASTPLVTWFLVESNSKGNVSAFLERRQAILDADDHHRLNPGIESDRMIANASPAWEQQLMEIPVSIVFERMLLRWQATRQDS